jgi:hypothetical protein
LSDSLIVKAANLCYVIKLDPSTLLGFETTDGKMGVNILAIPRSIVTKAKKVLKDVNAKIDKLINSNNSTTIPYNTLKRGFDDDEIFSFWWAL